MEDAHLIAIGQGWGCFGVFDGHGGDGCAKFVAKRWEEILRQQGRPPSNDLDVKKLMLKIDEEFLTSRPDDASGCTATMCIVWKPTRADERHRLHVINAGDSRVLLGRRNGAIMPLAPEGTDGGLTRDHKPDEPGERKRIEAAGGRVDIIEISEAEGSIARLNGDLAVSRGFGDRRFKKGGLCREENLVTADPEIGTLHCDETDFLLLVCDGVSEGDFPNAEVVRHAATTLDETGGNVGETARGVVKRALEEGSQDNITCMVVRLDGDTWEQKNVTFHPEVVTWLTVEVYRRPFEAMAARASLSLAQAVEIRYEELQRRLGESGSTTLTEDEQEELSKIGTPAGTRGSRERAEWFEGWARGLPVGGVPKPGWDHEKVKGMRS